MGALGPCRDLVEFEAHEFDDANARYLQSLAHIGMRKNDTGEDWSRWYFLSGVMPLRRHNDIAATLPSGFVQCTFFKQEDLVQRVGHALCCGSDLSTPPRHHGNLYVTIILCELSNT